MIKTCLKCNTPKDESEFGKDSRKKDGKRVYCKSCTQSMTAAIRTRDGYREAEREYARNYNREHKQERREYRMSYEANPETRKMIRKKSNQWLSTSPEKRLLYSARCRSKQQNLVCSITQGDIIVPEFCPVLGIKLEHGQGKAVDSSPSIDRIRPELGYITGNVAIISYRANTIKQNATPEELRKVADWLERTLQSVESPPPEKVPD